MLNLGENSEVLPLRKLSNDEIVDVLHARRLSRATSQHQSSQCQVVLQYDAAVNLGPVNLAFFPHLAIYDSLEFIPRYLKGVQS